MAYNFKNLSDVEIMEAVNDSANVLVEVDGDIKRTPKAQIGTVKSVNGVEPDENGDIKIAIDGDDVITQEKLDEVIGDLEGKIPSHKWETLEGKPFDEKKTVCFDGENWHKDVGYTNWRDVHVVYNGMDYEVEMEYWFDAGYSFIDFYDYDGNHIQFTDRTDATVPTGVTSVYKYELTTLDSKFIGDDIARLSDIPTHDWKSLDSKPFGEETGTTVMTLLPEQEMILAPMDSTPVDFSNELIESATYTVTVNGESKEIECVYDDTYGPEYVLTVSDVLNIRQRVGNNCLNIGNHTYERVTITLSIVGEGKIYSTLDEMYIPETIARVSDIPEHTWASLPDKPFGEVIGKNYCLEPTEFTGTSVYDLYLTLNGFDFYDSKTYKVSFDGETYECVSKFSDDGQGYDNISLGNWAIRSSTWPDTGEPFFFRINGATGSIDIYASTDGDHTIEIYTEEEVTKTIDSKYIGDDIARAKDITEHTWESLPDKPFGVCEVTIIDVQHPLANNDRFNGDYIDAVGLRVKAYITGSFGEFAIDSTCESDGMHFYDFPSAAEMVNFHVSVGMPGSYVIEYDDGSETIDSLKIVVIENKSLNSDVLPTTIPVIPTANVGDTIKVKAVDENGVPTEWEAVAAAEGANSHIVYEAPLVTTDGQWNMEVFNRLCDDFEHMDTDNGLWLRYSSMDMLVTDAATMYDAGYSYIVAETIGGSKYTFKTSDNVNEDYLDGNLVYYEISKLDIRLFNHTNSYTRPRYAKGETVTADEFNILLTYLVRSVGVVMADLDE